MNNKNTAGKQPRILNPNERKFLKITNSRWFTWGFALFWLGAAVNDYQRHHFSWLSGLVAGMWSIFAIIELIAVFRRKHG